MKTNKEIKVLFHQLSANDPSQEMEGLLQTLELQDTILTNSQVSINSTRMKKTHPFCKSKKVYRRGKQNGVQTYHCNDFNMLHSETIGTSLHDINLKLK